MFQIPSPAAPKLRPGERLVAGRPYVFDADLLRAYEADLQVESAPEDLSTFTDTEVSELWGAWLNRDRRKPFDALTKAVGERVCAERAARRSLSGAYTGRAPFEEAA